MDWIDCTPVTREIAYTTKSYAGTRSSGKGLSRFVAGLKAYSSSKLQLPRRCPVLNRSDLARAASGAIDAMIAL